MQTKYAKITNHYNEINMSRKLASVQQIAEIKSIDGADAIEAVRVNGWWCVSKKGEFQVGSECIYFEVDSVLPLESKYEFLRKSCYVKKDWIEGFRLKTIKLRGQISQGLVIPKDATICSPLGTDVTDMLCVKLWDPPVPASIAGQIKGNFPNYIPKTDQERIQNLDEQTIEKHSDHLFEITLKIDGSSCTIYYKDGEIGVCSRNLEFKMNKENAANSMVLAAKLVEDKFIKYCKENNCNLALQGELAGPGIQGNKLRFSVVEFLLFDVWNIDTQTYLTSDQRLKLIYELGINHVHVFPYEKILKKQTVQQLIIIAQNINIKEDDDPNNYEGLVFKSIIDPNFSFKVINNNYLLSEQ